MLKDKRILFEPWGLGDSLIAFAVALLRPGELSLACQSKWHPVLRSAAAVQGLSCPDLIDVDLSYVSRNKAEQFTRGDHDVNSRHHDLLSIRGDVRDYRAARALFPGASITMVGWIAFAAKRSLLIDLPFAEGILPVRSRYKAWTRITGVPWKHVLNFFMRAEPLPKQSLGILHIGAQWRSKQFPHVAELAALLRERGPVQIVAGPGDPLPPGVAETDVNRLVDGALVEALHAATYVVANDSGPMHAAALLRRRTIAITNHSAMREWLPPGVLLLDANGHRGHRATQVKPSDEVFGGWPSAREAASILYNMR